MKILKSHDKILSFDGFVNSNTTTYVSKALSSCEYVPVAEALLALGSVDFEKEQRAILEFLAYKQLNPNEWYVLLLNENWFDEAGKWFSEKVIKPASDALKGAINWVVELGSSIWEAIKGVVKRITDGLETAWDLVKLETQKWFGSNKSLKRQMTIEINSKVASLKESLLAEGEEDGYELSAKAIGMMTKEVGQLSKMFVDSVSKIIGGDVFASKVTQSLKKTVVNESEVSENDYIKDAIFVSILKMVPDAISTGSLDIRKITKAKSSGIITSFSALNALNEGIEIIDKFYEYAFKALEFLSPFKEIKQFTDSMEKDPNVALELLSKFLSSFFGIKGPYEFEMLGSVFAIVIIAAMDFAKYMLIDYVVAQLANFIIPGSGVVIMWLLAFYALYIVGESVYGMIQGQDDQEKTVQVA